MQPLALETTQRNLQMKKTFLSLAILAGLSGAAFAERPSESSDRVDYKFLATDAVNQSEASEAGLAATGVIIDEAEQRRLDEKNDPSDNNGGAR
jgi:hypothetical protein